jgi:hypothetical protein
MKATSVVGIGLAFAACGGDDELSSKQQQVDVVQHISDAANPPGPAGFYLLVPLADVAPTTTGTFNNTLKTRLKVDVRNLDCSTFAVGSTFKSLSLYLYTDQYKVNTNVTTLGLVTGNCYRVVPTLDGAQLGFRDAQVTSGTPPAGLKKWTPGSNLTFSFRIEGNFDTDGDGVLNHVDNCPNDQNPDQADSDMDGVGNVCDVADSDGDGVPDSTDNCVNDPNPGQQNADGDALGDACDSCSTDANKTAPGVCGCGTPDTDSDGDGTADCVDGCPADSTKTAPGACGCGTPDTDSDGDGTPNCMDGCPNDMTKTTPGICGCGIPETDSDSDGRPNCIETCTP